MFITFVTHAFACNLLPNLFITLVFGLLTLEMLPNVSAIFCFLYLAMCLVLCGLVYFCNLAIDLQ